MSNRPIQRLSDEVIGKIAAGEVVERPAAAVKELVENSIDAGATAVTVELTDGGLTAIRVSDNGAGIPAPQIRMAFERHATSKLVDAEELYEVHTLGFRGEALASIAAVAKVSATTRTADAAYGVKAQVDAGEFKGVTEAASPVGTGITVRELFYNAPVRLKFLKKPATEAAYVSDYIMRLILSRPDVAFRFVNQGKTVYRSAGDGTLESALYCVYGKDALRAMRRVTGAEEGVAVDGYVGVGELARGNRLQQSFFVNGRYFRDEALSKALESGCEGYVMIGRYPVCALSLTLPYRQVDVNVHPNKLEVRFQRPDAVAVAVETLTRRALRTVTVQDKLAGETAEAQTAAGETVEVLELTKEPALEDAEAEKTADAVQKAAFLSFDAPAMRETAIQPNATCLVTETVTNETHNESEHDNHYVTDEYPPMTLPSPKRDKPATMQAVNDAETTRTEAVQERMTPEEPTQLRYIGTAFRTYLLFEAGERLLLVDQHAAHERVLYDRFMARYQGSNASQRLLAPRTVRLTAREVALLTEMNEALAQAGFELEAFDATTVAVRAVPVILGESVPVRDTLMDVLDETKLSRGKVTGDRLRARVAQLACKHAVKGGDALTEADVKALIAQMLETGAQPTCPHGRPIVSEITRRELEKRFKRIQ